MGNLNLVNGSVLVLDLDGKVLSLSEGIEAEDLRRRRKEERKSGRGEEGRENERRARRGRTEILSVGLTRS